MCGIVGYVGGRDAVPVILDGLRRLEYRGYDSAGIAVVRGGDLLRRRSAGKLGNLAASLAAEPLHGDWGIGHTRWATHGRPTEENAHPHQDCSGRIVVVHNGIIENYLELKARLSGAGHAFVTQTDTEVVAHLVESLYQGSLEDAARAALAQVHGVYALVLLHRDEPHRLVAARMGPPLVVGLGEGEHFVASDIPALLPHTRDFLFLEDGDVATVTPQGVRVTTLAGVPVERKPQRIAWDPVQAEKGGYRHFMLKEIHEQPRAMRDTLLGRISLEEGEVHLEELGEAADRLREASRVVLLACGTSWHAALVGKFLIEHLARLPAEVDYGSEFRYRTPIVGPGTVAVAISQSGETADTLAAFREAKARGALPLAICNVQGSMLTREAAGSLLTHAGPEIGVASTKAFTAQLVALSLLALHLGRLRGTLSAEACREHLAQLTRVPHLMELRPRAGAGGRGPLAGAVPRPRLPLPRAGGQLPDRPRGRPEAQGDLLPPRRGLPGGRDEARADRPRGRGPPRGGAVPRRATSTTRCSRTSRRRRPAGGGWSRWPPPATPRSRSCSTGPATRSSRSLPARSCGRRS